MNNFELIDIWRELHPNESQVTWKRVKPYRVYFRLDYFLILWGLLGKTSDAHIAPGFKTDHASVNISVDFTLGKRGPGFWKLNCSYLSEPGYRE